MEDTPVPGGDGFGITGSQSPRTGMSHRNPPAQPGVLAAALPPPPRRHLGAPQPPRAPQPPSRPPTSKDPIYPLQPLLSPANSRLEQAAPPGP